MKGMWRMRLLVAVGLVLGGAGAALAQSEAQPMGPGAAGVAAAPAATAGDEAITSTIRTKLDAMKLLHNAQVTIASVGGVVTLVGTVPSDFARMQALEAARNTAGVLRIDDQLRLDISSPSAPTRN
jgi:osmotically-inducible protein OsmY